MKLSRKVKKRMFDLGLDKRGGQTKLAERLNINRNSLNMALSGYRTGPGSEQILKDALRLLKSWPQEAA